MAHLDSQGEPLQKGDKAIYLEAREDLLHGLPASDRKAIEAQVGEAMAVEGFDDYGNVELEFIDAKDIYHTIWVEPDCLKKIG